MAKLYNLARMTTATTGSGTITLGAAVNSFISFAQAGAQDGDELTYAIDNGNQREIGRGIYHDGATPTLTRSVLRSTNANNPINLNGLAQVSIAAAAEDLGEIIPSGGAQFQVLGKVSGTNHDMAWQSVGVRPNNNFGIGNNIFAALTSGAWNTALGDAALQKATTGSENIAVGPYALHETTTGTRNIAIGVNALLTAADGLHCMAIGANALAAVVTAGSATIAIGSDALANTQVVNTSVVIGVGAAQHSHTADGVVAIGQAAAHNLISASNCILMGANAITLSAASTNEIVIGANAVGKGNNTATIGNSSVNALWCGGFLSADAIGINFSGGQRVAVGPVNPGWDGGPLMSNCGIGIDIFTALTTGAANIALGDHAMSSVTTSNYSIAIGPWAMMNATEGESNVAIGNSAMSGAQPSNTNAQASVAIGWNALNLKRGPDGAVSIGSMSGQNYLTARFTTTVGTGAAMQQTGDANTAFGHWALRGDWPHTAVGVNNVAIGAAALTYFGATAQTPPSLTSLTLAANNCTFVGTFSRASSANPNNEIVIGHNAVGNGDNTATIGNASTNSLWCGGGKFIVGPNNNFGIGSNNTLSALTTGSNNIVLGNGALQNRTTGSDGIAIGTNALQMVVGGIPGIIAIGTNALQAVTSGNNSIAIGMNALLNAEVAQSSVAIGVGAAQSYQEAAGIVAIGHGAAANQTGDGNLAFGFNAMRGVPGSSGTDNIAIGTQTLLNVTGGSNTAIGSDAFFRLGGGWQNTAIGSQAGAYFGDDPDPEAAGHFVTTASGCIYIGHHARASSATPAGEIVIGTGTSQGANSVTFGNALSLFLVNNFSGFSLFRDGANIWWLRRQQTAGGSHVNAIGIDANLNIFMPNLPTSPGPAGSLYRSGNQVMIS